MASFDQVGFDGSSFDTDPPTPSAVLTLTGFAVALLITIATPVGALSLDGQTPQSAPGPVFAIPTASLSLSGTSTVPAYSRFIGAGAVTATGQAVESGESLNIPVSTLQVSGQPVRLLSQVLVPVGALPTTGQAPSVQMSTGPAAFDPASFDNDGFYTASEERAGAGALAVVGQPVEVGLSQNIPLGSLVAVVGYAPTPSLQIPIPSASLPLTGQTPSVDRGLKVNPGAGALAISGQSPEGEFEVDVPAGAITLIGNAPTLQTLVRVPAGLLSDTGQPNEIDQGYGAPAGIVTITGRGVILQITAQAPTGVLSCSGQAPGLSTLVRVPSGSLTAVGTVVENDLGIQPNSATITLLGQAEILQTRIAVPAGSEIYLGHESPLRFPVDSAVLGFSGQAPSISGVVSRRSISRNRALLDPRLRTVMPEHWPSRCTIQLVVFAISDSRQKVPIGGSDIAGMINLQSRLGPIIEVRPTDNEIRDVKVLESYRRRQCKLNGYFPHIGPRLMRAIVDGEVFEIRGVEHDSEHFSTRLMLEVINPHG